MLFTIQFPLTDLRPFVAVPTDRLTVPAWLAPLPDRDFVRSFGALRRRPRGGLSGWLGESIICEANRAVRFQSIPPFEDQAGGKLKFKIAFRRFYSDGLAVNKFEVGVAVWGFRNRQLSSDRSKELLYHLMDLPVVLPNPLQDDYRGRLWQIGHRLAELYATSSTCSHAARGRLGQILHRLAELLGIRKPSPDWWVQACEPVILVTFDERKEKLQIPFSGKPVPIRSHDCTGTQLATLSHHVIPREGQNLRLWMLGEFGASEQIRQLRIFLLRLHTEETCFRHTLRSIATRKLVVAPRSAESDRLQHYFNVAPRRIGTLNERSNAAADTEVGKLAREARDYVMPGDRDALMEALKAIDIRPNIYRKTDDFLTKQVFIQELVMGHKIGEVQMGDQFEMSGDFRGAIINIKSRLENVTQTVNNAAAVDDLSKMELNRLLAELKEILEETPEDREEEAEAVAMAAEELVEKGTAEKPNKAMVRISGEGLKQAAQNLADVMPTVLTIAMQIVTVIQRMRGQG